LKKLKIQNNIPLTKNIPPTPFKGGVKPEISIIFWIVIFHVVTQWSCIIAQEIKNPIIVGSERMETYFPLLQNKRLGVVANQTSLIVGIHLVDTLISSGFDLVRIFAPEHGFRGEAGAGEEIIDGADKKTGIPVISLYGKNKKPNAEDLQEIDVLLFDIQDVGVRFYTYISTLALVMESCAENNIPLIVLDRPNPHGDYVDGPVLKSGFTSFVGMHPVPIVYGMTIGEYAMMVNGERWLKDSLKCDLTVIPCQNYDHNTRYVLPVPPSPNLPNDIAIQLYPSLCLFEGTIVSVGRGTDMPFQVIGHPDYVIGSFIFVPEDKPGKAMDPPYEGAECLGFSLQSFGQEIEKDRRLHLTWLCDMYHFFNIINKPDFFNSFFDKLAGSDQLRLQILADKTETEIRQSWEDDISVFLVMRKKYLLYPDFK
jgi:uncharacterized protein YbbC (DUF1343 family)